MGLPYRARVDERWHLDLPGIDDDRTYVLAYVEDTSQCDLRSDPTCDETCGCCPSNYEPRVPFELGNRWSRFSLVFEVEEPWRRQSLHAIDTMLASLQAMRAGIVAEGEEYDRRDRLLDEERSFDS